MKQVIFMLVMLCISPFVAALEAKKISGAIVIDGNASERSWSLADWQPLDQLIIGEQPSADDFSGRYKVMWDDQQLYILLEITDDVLLDRHANPLDQYWNDDCVEIFVDEDSSGGDHQFNYNAFAYHVALDNQVADIGEKNADGSDNFVLLNSHLTSRWRRNTQVPHQIIWEVALHVYDDSFKLNNKLNKPVTLHRGKQLGFMLAYCDNDYSDARESFIGSTLIKAVNGSKNLGYITSDVFDRLTLVP